MRSTGPFGVRQTLARRSRGLVRRDPTRGRVVHPQISGRCSERHCALFRGALVLLLPPWQRCGGRPCGFDCSSQSQIIVNVYWVFVWPCMYATLLGMLFILFFVCVFYRMSGSNI